MSDKEKGLYHKYHITKTSGKSIPPEARMFVLRYDQDTEYGRASRQAMLLLAQELADSYPQLAKDLRREVSRNLYQSDSHLVAVIDQAERIEAFLNKHQLEIDTFYQNQEAIAEVVQGRLGLDSPGILDLWFEKNLPKIHMVDSLSLAEVVTHLRLIRDQIDGLLEKVYEDADG